MTGRDEIRPSFDEGSRSSEESDIEQFLRVRGLSIRIRPGMTDRIHRATVTLIAPGQPRVSSSSSAWFTLRWGAGLAAAASIAAAVFIGIMIQPPPSGVALAAADRVGADSEPILVALLAGSEVVDHDPAFAPEFLDADAMPILRSRDAAFGDLDTEVRVIVAMGVPR
ncbi:MAG: hypothetical protein EXS03_03200 [Phycisphaerales bacterium]|nr:hypothetical protein [Phycisphaerales bacterium]